jgi:ABC-type bacteriocin/lantibiotic exporter with double-glycine peptidase domain
VLQISHTPQTNPQGRNSCVPAAVRMVLAFQGSVFGEEELCELFETQQAGTEVLNVLLLNQRLPGCHAEVISASLDDLMRWLQQDIPPIVFVTTGPLRYWHTECLHALVVVGIEEQAVLVHDPAFAHAPLTIPHGEFLAAWGELAQLTALIRVSHVEP